MSYLEMFEAQKDELFGENKSKSSKVIECLVDNFADLEALALKDNRLVELRKLASFICKDKGLVKELFTIEKTTMKSKSGVVRDVELKQYAITGLQVRSVFKRKGKENLLRAIVKRPKVQS